MQSCCSGLFTSLLGAASHVCTAGTIPIIAGLVQTGMPASIAVWLKLDKNYRNLVGYFMNKYKSGLLPEWCMASGGDAMKDNKLFYYFSLDVYQVPVKLAWYYSWFGPSGNDVYAEDCDKIASWITEKTSGNIQKAVLEYSLDGNPLNPISVPYSGGAIGITGIVSEKHQKLFNNSYKYLINHKTGKKLGYSLDVWALDLYRVYMLLFYSHNLVLFMDE